MMASPSQVDRVVCLGRYLGDSAWSIIIKTMRKCSLNSFDDHS